MLGHLIILTVRTCFLAYILSWLGVMTYQLGGDHLVPLPVALTLCSFLLFSCLPVMGLGMFDLFTNFKTVSQLPDVAKGAIVCFALCMFFTPIFTHSELSQTYRLDRESSSLRQMLDAVETKRSEPSGPTVDSTSERPETSPSDDCLVQIFGTNNLQDDKVTIGVRLPISDKRPVMDLITSAIATKDLIILHNGDRDIILPATSIASVIIDDYHHGDRYRRVEPGWIRLASNKQDK